MNIEVLKRTRHKVVSRNQFVKWTLAIRRQLLTQLPVKKAKILREARDLIIVFVDRAEGRKLNKNFRGKNYATDILSFSQVEQGSLGELVFCAPVLAKQAREHKLSLKDETLYLYIHGLLHLLGYDHEKSAAQARAMFKIQDQIFSKNK